MIEMKDSGIEWIGEIPRHWKVGRTKNCYTNHKDVVGDEADNYERLALTLGGVIKRSKVDATGLQPEAFEGYQILRENELVFKLIDLENVATSRVGYSPYTGIVSPAYIVLTPRESDESRFGEYFFLSMWQREVFNHMGDDGVRSSLNSKDLLNIPYLIVPSGEKAKIVAFLDKQCAEIDSVIEQTKATIEEYKKLKQSVITEAVTKGIRGDRPMKDSGIEWIGEIPAEWNLIQIKHLKSKDKNAFVDGPFGSNLKSIHFVENGDVYVVESGFITTGKFVFKKFKTITSSHFETIKRSECKANDVIIAKIGANFGMAAELPKLDKPSVVSGNSLKITLDQAKILNSIFVYELGIAKNRGGYVGLYNETAQPALSLSTLNSFKLVVAPIEEQKEIANYLYGKCAEIDTLIAKKTALLDEMETYKKSVIYEYVTGKKEVYKNAKKCN